MAEELAFVCCPLGSRDEMGVKEADCRCNRHAKLRLPDVLLTPYV